MYMMKRRVGRAAGAAAASRDMRSASGVATPSDSAFMNVRRRSARELVINTTF